MKNIIYLRALSPVLLAVTLSAGCALEADDGFNEDSRFADEVFDAEMEQLAMNKGCLGCHAVDESVVIGPGYASVRKEYREGGLDQKHFGEAFAAQSDIATLPAFVIQQLKIKVMNGGAGVWVASGEEGPLVENSGVTPGMLMPGGMVTDEKEAENLVRWILGADYGAAAAGENDGGLSNPTDGGLSDSTEETPDAGGSTPPSEEGEADDEGETSEL